ncbi:MAG: glycoside hydrolase family 88 protein [Anaerolineae bacterium]|nr:glycoside hydrolase family 88 protein [Anaerolineae bacterium]
MSDLTYLVGRVVSARKMSLPESMRLSRGWHAFPVVPHSAPTLLHWDSTSELPLNERPRLRLSVALASQEDILLEAISLANGRVIARFDIRHAHAFQPFEVLLSAQAARDILTEGLGLRLVQGDAPLWLLHDPDSDAEPALMPHVLISTSSDRLQAFRYRLNSLASLQPFGWQAGCVLDGLLDMAEAGLLESDLALRTLRAHFAHFFDSDGNLDYEDDSGRPQNGINSTAYTLPFAVLVRTQPDHPALKVAIRFWHEARAVSSVVQDGNVISAEESYTTAYPMAQIGVLRNEPSLVAMALEQLRARRPLFTGDSLALSLHSDGTRTFINWARAAAWYLLGLVRTLAIVPNPPADLREAFAQAAQWAVRRQNKQGVWHAFVDAPEVQPDNGSSAGIAAALALGVKAGLLSSAMREPAVRAAQALSAALTPDGFLTGVAQADKGNEALQRDDYRVISQFGMGLLAQLYAALT